MPGEGQQVGPAVAGVAQMGFQRFAAERGFVGGEQGRFVAALEGAEVVDGFNHLPGDGVGPGQWLAMLLQPVEVAVDGLGQGGQGCFLAVAAQAEAG